MTALAAMQAAEAAMDQQHTSGRDQESTGSSSQQQQQPQNPRSSSSADDTWGLGSSSALDRLRERNFRGRRSANDGRPASD
jgi:hypothetical protein